MTPRLERPPISLRISVTDRCALRCVYCRPETGVSLACRDQLLSFDEILRFVREVDGRYGLAHVRLTGGEPLVRRDVDQLIARLREAGTYELALTTNGQHLASYAGRLKHAGLDRINISLDTLDAETFSEITRGGILRHTLEGIDAALDATLHPVKLNVVVMRGVNDHDAPELVRFAMDHHCEIRFLELMPIGVAANRFDERFVPSEATLATLASPFTLSALPVDPHVTSRNYVARDARGRSTVVGFISPFSQPFCHGCSRLRLTATGDLLGCIARSEGIPLAGLLRGHSHNSDGAIAAAVDQALTMKRRDGEFIQPRVMVGIGG